MLAYDCDALLPIEQRYTSDKFRQLSRRFTPAKLDWAYAVECVAWVTFLGGFAQARWTMVWSAGMRVEIEKLLANDALVEASAELVEANKRSVVVADGYAILRAMQAGGWRQRNLPIWVKMMLRERASNGESVAAIARECRLSYAQVSNVVYDVAGPVCVEVPRVFFG